MKRLFQSTHSRGVRLIFLTALSTSDLISIHALTGSATYERLGFYIEVEISIHALTGSATKVEEK